MPVTVRPASHPARELWISHVTSIDGLFQASCPKESRDCNRILQSSFTGAEWTGAKICPSRNGLVMAVYEAYSHHHHLKIRPEDVWLSILTQMSFHINAHAEELRSLFVRHEGKEQLVVTAVGNIETIDLGGLAVELTKEMNKKLVNPEFHDWIMPSFTTTTSTDTVTAAIIMMGAMQEYFSYRMNIRCGIPSVTLLGDKADWINIRRRLDKLSQFGKEPEQFATLLCPILDYFIRTFENVDDPKVMDFWTKIADARSNSSGPSYLSGWITAFCFWNGEGKLLYHESQDACDLDGTSYFRVDTSHIPSAYVSVPVVLDDNGNEFKTKMVAGLVGMAASSSGEQLDIGRSHKSSVRKRMSPKPGLVDVTPVPSDAPRLDSLQPVAGWWMYESENWVA
jgi:hypothetical protein